MKAKIFQNKNIKIHFILISICIIYLGFNIFTFFFTFGENITRINANAISSGRSGITDNVVTVDNEEADYYYYLGQNYTDSDGTMPTKVNKNIYNDSNLIKVKITYSSVDRNSNFKGYVSYTELQDTYVYYSVYPIVDGYVTIELIDNPFVNRPDDKGFNGWTTNYPGAKISYDDTYYTRYVKVPVSDTTTDIDITMHASWLDANVEVITNSWSNLSNFDSKTMKKVSAVYTEITYGDFDMSGYYKAVTINYWGSCRGYYNQNGNYQNGWCTCFNSDGCTYYSYITNENYKDGQDYYELVNNNMTLVDPSTLDRPIISTEEKENPNLGIDANMSAYYKKVTISRYASIEGFYNINGVLQTGTCNTNGGCTLYELVQYYDDVGNENKYQEENEYYYLPTRDTNIAVLTNSISSRWSNVNKPFTVTSLHNGTDYRNNATWNLRTGAWNGISVYAYNDLTLENIKINYGSSLTNSKSDTPGDTNSIGSFYGNWHNVKLGRGILQSGTNASFDSVLGGSNSATGSRNKETKYKLIIESGFYNSISLSNGGINQNSSSYIKAKGLYGNDYDKVLKNNDNLVIAYASSGSWGGIYYTIDPVDIGFDLIVRSGSFGKNKYDAYAGIYIGGRGWGTHYTSRRVKYEGGYTYNLIGGPITGTNRSNYNDSYMYITGGEIDMVIGGAGQTATYGNRIVQMTGGTINYSIFGGSNGYESGNGEGTVNGSAYIYVGGKAIIGKSEYVNNKNELYGATAGNIFGIGNGNSSYDTIGSSDASVIIINDEAQINNDVYGGGNFSSVGVSSTKSSTTTDIEILGGTIYGSLYGGGNKNGSGSSRKSATVTINMYNGDIYGGLYGGANQKGTIYGDININIYGGTIHSSVYGGGLGGYQSSSSPGTFVGNNVNIVIGSDDYDTIPVINSVYGGSSFGSVNGTSNNASASDYNTKVTVNKGKITNVFGGGQGNDTYTPKVYGDILVTVNNGEITNVFGANDVSGMPSKSVKVLVNNGVIQNVYGGGNKTNLTTSDVTINDGNITNTFGGSNETGDVITSNIIVNGGILSNIYGGNNIGGSTKTSNVTIKGGNTTNAYGGGKLATTDKTNITVTDNAIITNTYGGGESADVTTVSNVSINNGVVTNTYGGSNVTGTVTESIVNATDGKSSYIYGGNNAGGTTSITNVTIDGVNVKEVYGGGNKANTNTSNITVNNASKTIDYCFGGGREASVDTTNVLVNGGSIKEVYGGSNVTGTVTNSNVNVASKLQDTPQVLANITYTLEATTWQSTEYPTLAKIKVELVNNTNASITNYNGSLYIPDSKLFTNYSSTAITEEDFTYSFNENNIYYGTNPIPANSSISFEIEVLSKASASEFTLSHKFEGRNGTNSYVDKTGEKIIYVYGGNNVGGKTVNSSVLIDDGNITNVYGGGNEAVTDNPVVKINGGNISKNIYGGGNQAIVTNSTNVSVIGGSIGGSVYGGGNGQTAIVNKNTLVNISDKANITKHVFGGGNAAATGKSENNNSTSTVNIIGGTIKGSVYGGANTSVVYGEAFVNIGENVISDKTLTKSDIDIAGTIFGGGEANESGSEIYDYSFISVTVGINIKIDGKGYDNFAMHGSIFGSGNASSTTGYSYINIDNYGTFDNYQKNISIQRADIVTISNSAIELYGATDRTNEYSDVLFTISRVKNLKLKNNSTLFLQTGSNLLEHFSSLVDVDGNEILASVDISDDGTITKNVNNRLYMLEGKNLNVAINEQVTQYGEVSGMTFFGMYKLNASKNAITALYNPKYEQGSNVSNSDAYAFMSGSYVLGLHQTNHDIKINGFYSNFIPEDNSEVIKVDYINPIPEDSNYYMWVIGEQVASYEITLTASKYLTLGTVELPLRNNYNANSVFSIVGFNYDGLDSSVSFIDEADVPRIASNPEDADKIMGLSVKNGSGFITKGTLSFLTGTNDNLKGTKDFERENTTSVPSLVFYLYHSKNLQTSGNMGSVIVSMLVTTKVDDLNSEVERVNVIINLTRALYNTNEYEATIAPSKHYEMFATSDVRITNNSSFSTYYSLYMPSDTTPYKEGYHRSLVSTYLFPEGTKITMIDIVTRTVPEYYYHVVTRDDVINGEEEYRKYKEVSYDFSKFTKMGSTSLDNLYSDERSNNIYYNDTDKYTHEEFIFIVDFSGANITDNQINKSLLIELRNKENRTVTSVLGASQSSMFYSVYAGVSAKIELDASFKSKEIYPGNIAYLNIKTNFVKPIFNNVEVADTTFDDEKLGIKLSIFDANGNIVTGASLLGLSFNLNGKTYYPRTDGTTRINIASSVANVSSDIKINTPDSFAPGSYKLLIESFGSPDGIYYGLYSSASTEIDFKVLNNSYGLSIDMRDEMMIVDKTSGFTLLGNNSLVYILKHSSVLENPSIRVSLYRRNYDTPYSLNYDLVDIKDFINYNYIDTTVDKEYIMLEKALSENNIFMSFKDNLKTGTYRLTFSIYDNNEFIGNIYKYLLIK